MAVQEVKGYIFNTQNQYVVNPINTVGVMGKGLALAFRYLYPNMFNQYKSLCEHNQIKVGKCWLYTNPGRLPSVVNLATKKHYRDPSQIEYVEAGLADFVANYNNWGVKSAAFPLLGAGLGGLNPKDVLFIMKNYLEPITIPVEIYHYDKAAEKIAFQKIKAIWLANDYKTMKNKLDISNWHTLNDFIHNPQEETISNIITAKNKDIHKLLKLFDE